MPLRLIIALLGAHQRPAADPDDGAADDEDDPGEHDQCVLDGAARLRHQRQDQVPKPEREREPESERDHQRRRGKGRGLSPRVLARRNEQLAADQRWVDGIGQRDRDHSHRELEHGVRSIALGPRSATPAVDQTPLHPDCGLLARGPCAEVLRSESVRIAYDVQDLGVLGTQPDRGVGARGLTSAFASGLVSGSRAQRRRSAGSPRPPRRRKGGAGRLVQGRQLLMQSPFRARPRRGRTGRDRTLIAGERNVAKGVVSLQVCEG